MANVIGDKDYVKNEIKRVVANYAKIYKSRQAKDATATEKAK